MSQSSKPVTQSTHTAPAAHETVTRQGAHPTQSRGKQQPARKQASMLVSECIAGSARTSHTQTRSTPRGWAAAHQCHTPGVPPCVPTRCPSPRPACSRPPCTLCASGTPPPGQPEPRMPTHGHATRVRGGSQAVGCHNPGVPPCVRTRCPSPRPACSRPPCILYASGKLPPA